jgi:HEAT repeat protein
MGGMMPLFGRPDVRKLEQKRDIKELIKALKHREEGVCSEAAEALGRIGWEAINPLISEIRKPPYTQITTWVAVALAKIGEPVVEPLIRAQATAASEGNVGLLTKAALVSGQVLRQVGEPAVKTLIRMLSDPDANVRGLVTAALGAIGEPAVEPLLRVLTDPRSEVRVGAAVALGQICDRKAIEHLRRALRDDNRWVRLHSAGALTKIDTSEIQAIKLLKEAAQDYGPDSSDDYRGVAALYLKQIPPA